MGIDLSHNLGGSCLRVIIYMTNLRNEMPLFTSLEVNDLQCGYRKEKVILHYISISLCLYLHRALLRLCETFYMIVCLLHYTNIYVSSGSSPMSSFQSCSFA